MPNHSFDIARVSSCTHGKSPGTAVAPEIKDVRAGS